MSESPGRSESGGVILSLSIDNEAGVFSRSLERCAEVRDVEGIDAECRDEPGRDEPGVGKRGLA